MRQEELRRQSFNAIWNDNGGVTTVRGEVLHVDASRPHPFGFSSLSNFSQQNMAPISVTNNPKTSQKQQKIIQEQKALVKTEGYDTGKSSSSTGSDEPPPVPPHRNATKTSNISKIDVKSLAAKFEKR